MILLFTVMQLCRWYVKLCLVSHHSCCICQQKPAPPPAAQPPPVAAKPQTVPKPHVAPKPHKDRPTEAVEPAVVAAAPQVVGEIFHLTLFIVYFLAQLAELIV